MRVHAYVDSTESAYANEGENECYQGLSIGADGNSGHWIDRHHQQQQPGESCQQVPHCIRRHFLCETLRSDVLQPSKYFRQSLFFETNF